MGGGGGTPFICYCKSRYTTRLVTPLNTNPTILYCTVLGSELNGGLQLSSRVFRKGQARKAIEYEAHRLPQMATPYSLPRNAGHPHRSWLLLQPILGRSRQRRMLFLW